MFLGNTIFINTENVGATGASVISERNYELVLSNSSSVLRYSISLTLKNIKSNIKSIFFDSMLVGCTDVRNILSEIKSHEINTVFIDTSMLGNLAKEIRNTFPNVYIIGFFHNIEHDYFKELILVTKKFQHYFTLQLVKKAESQMAENADVIITLNKRDAKSLKLLYKRSVDLILPTSFVDKFDENKSYLEAGNGECLNLLFVGSYFPPNIFAVNWFVENVMPHLTQNITLYIVGNGFENHNLNKQDSRIRMIGSVSDLGCYYYMTDLVIAPIFHGSGMKTKIAEALMYNKPIIGTKESFEGYEININLIGKQSEIASEYISFINNFKKKGSFSSRKIFLDNYSSERINDNFYRFLYERK